MMCNTERPFKAKQNVSQILVLTLSIHNQNFFTLSEISHPFQAKQNCQIFIIRVGANDGNVADINISGDKMKGRLLLPGEQEPFVRPKVTTLQTPSSGTTLDVEVDDCMTIPIAGRRNGCDT
jgi:hypothetical protein